MTPMTLPRPVSVVYRMHDSEPPGHLVLLIALIGPTATAGLLAGVAGCRVG
jgi:hypothetical protein